MGGIWASGGIIFKPSYSSLVPVFGSMATFYRPFAKTGMSLLRMMAFK
jgi:hypothetical protein